MAPIWEMRQRRRVTWESPWSTRTTRRRTGCAACTTIPYRRCGDARSHSGGGKVEQVLEPFLRVIRWSAAGTEVEVNGEQPATWPDTVGRRVPRTQTQIRASGLDMPCPNSSPGTPPPQLARPAREGHRPTRRRCRTGSRSPHRWRCSPNRRRGPRAVADATQSSRQFSLNRGGRPRGLSLDRRNGARRNAPSKGCRSFLRSLSWCYESPSFSTETRNDSPVIPA
jgi:hypothetical protein